MANFPVIPSRGDRISDLFAQSDEQLMRLYQQGEYGAFDELYRRHAGRVYGFLKKRLSGPGEADDLLQQVFLKLHANRDRYEPTLPFVPWLFSITRNIHVDFLRKHQAIPTKDTTLAALADEESLAASSEPGEHDWEEVLSLLPVEQRKLLELRFEEGLSFEEIAAMYELTEVTVRKRLSRTIHFLRERLFGTSKGVKS